MSRMYNDRTKNAAAALLAELAADPKPNFLWYTNRANLLVPAVTPPDPNHLPRAIPAVAVAHPKRPEGWKCDAQIVQETIAAINAKMEVAYNLRTLSPSVAGPAGPAEQ